MALITPEDIVRMLTRGRTKGTVDRLADRMVTAGVDLAAFFREVDRQPSPLKWHLTWVLSHYVERLGALGPRDQRRIWDALGASPDDSVRRDLWRALSFVTDIDDDIAGAVFDTAVRVVTSSKEPIAIRAHAMFAARNVALPYPELRRELRLVLEALTRDESAAVRARSRNVVRELTTRDRFA